MACHNIMTYLIVHETVSLQLTEGSPMKVAAGLASRTGPPLLVLVLTPEACLQWL